MRESCSRSALGIFVLAVALIIGSTAFAAEPPLNSNLHLANGGFVAGSLQDSDQPGIVRWQPASFVDPFEFPINRVNSIRFGPPAEPSRPSGDYSFELGGGDLVFGALVALGDREAVLDVPRLGRLHVERSHLHRMERRRDRADVVYVGPNGLTDWKQPSPKDGWHEDAGQLWTEREGASLRGDFGLPNRAVIELAISWKKKPDFVFALAVDDDEATLRQAFRFEVWEKGLVVYRELANAADVATVRKVDLAAPGRIHLLAYLDQEQGKLRVFEPNGKRLADLTLAGPQPQVHKGLALTNIRGDVRLETLRIGSWSGAFPGEVPANEARIHRTDGSIVQGQVTRFDAPSKEFVIRGESGESRIAEDMVASVFLSHPDDEPARTIRAVAHDGVRLSGELVRVEKGELCLSIPGVEESPRLAVSGLSSLVVLRPEVTPTNAHDPIDRLEIEGVRLRGRLLDGQPRPGWSGLIWHPQGSATASPLRLGVSGRILRKEPPPPPPATPARGNTPIVNGNLGNIIVFPAQMEGRVVRVANPRPAAGPLALHLRTGDVIPAEVTTIDENGVWFRTKLSTSTFVAHEKVKAVELAREAISEITLTKSKRERLLTLPRMQKESPPTHLIRSMSGDYLRGRLIAMDDKKLQIEVRLETKEVPRDLVSRIIWFHPDELEATPNSAKPSQEGPFALVQAVRSDGVRLTFYAEQTADGALSGKSNVLGECRVRLDEIDQLLIGAAIEQSAVNLAYQQWKLQNAVEPKVAQNDDEPGAGRVMGTESALVGKPAPDFSLDLLEGKTFRLAESKGKIVVLDFWATWCGPCLQAMPQVDRVTREFQDQGVQLVAVNLQETPKAISAMLERHKLSMPVALDRTGAVAEKYAATAIPQTVIIDREGTIVRLFVGGGPHFEDQLRDALRTVLPLNGPQ